MGYVTMGYVKRGTARVEYEPSQGAQHGSTLLSLDNIILSERSPRHKGYILYFYEINRQVPRDKKKQVGGARDWGLGRVA